jgi:hypothetical protein
MRPWGAALRWGLLWSAPTAATLPVSPLVFQQPQNRVPAKTGVETRGQSGGPRRWGDHRHPRPRPVDRTQGLGCSSAVAAWLPWVRPRFVPTLLSD